MSERQKNQCRQTHNSLLTRCDKIDYPDSERQVKREYPPMEGCIGNSKVNTPATVRLAESGPGEYTAMADRRRAGVVLARSRWQREIMKESPDNESSAAEQDDTQVRVERIVCDEAGELSVYLAGVDEPIVGASVARCFPWSLPEGFICIRHADGREIVLLDSLNDLDQASQEVVAGELRHKVFRPRITRVTSCRTEFGVTSISAETDRGEVTFQLGSRDDVQMLSPTRILFRDVDGNAYELADTKAVDAETRRRLHFLL